MDALKKAEQAKRQVRGELPDAGVEASASELRLAPTEPVSVASGNGVVEQPQAVAPSPAASSVDASKTAMMLEMSAPSTSGSRAKLPPSMSIPDSDFLGMAPPSVATTRRTHEPQGARPLATSSDPGSPRAPATPELRSNTPAAERVAAANVFSAKQTPTAGRNGSFALIAGSLAVLGAACIGGYVWWQLQPRGLVAVPGSVSPAVVPARNSTPSASESPSVAGTPTAVPPQPTSAASAEVPVKATDATGNAVETATPRPPPRRASSTQSTIENDSPVKPSRTPVKVDPQLQMAYDAFGRGDIAAARHGYESVLAGDPNNIDALLGLATMALREDRPEQAEHRFRQALLINPKEGRAMSGLLEIYGKTQPAAAEPRLRALITDYPDLPAPQVALGNLYARSQRWHEAQQAFFAAYSLQPENADVLFNLAISLEHLKQPRLARQYYGEALKAARQGSAQFDPAIATERLRALSEQ